MSTTTPITFAVEETYRRLTEHLRELQGVVVAFSGGVDSSLVLAAAVDALGSQCLAVTACSATYPDEEKVRAIEIARFLSARHRVIDTHELEDPAYRSNPPNRCYHCKRELFERLRAIASEAGCTTLVDGSNQDDRTDYRPGRQAVQEYAVRSPLAELGLGKAAVRELARHRGIPNWDHPACACLASRVPYGEEITDERLRRIGGTEAALRSLGFRVVRARDHGSLVRLELGREDIDKAAEAGMRERLVAGCRAHGYQFVALDLEGYRTGAMNEVLPLGETTHPALAPSEVPDA